MLEKMSMNGIYEDVLLPEDQVSIAIVLQMTCPEKGGEGVKYLVEHTSPGPVCGGVPDRKLMFAEFRLSIQLFVSKSFQASYQPWT